MSAGAQEFSSRRAIAPMMWTLLAIGLCELAVAHVLIALWSRTAALAVAAVTIPALGWLIAGIMSLRSRPSVIAGGMLDLRAGRMRGVAVPLSCVAGTRGVASAAAVKAPGVLNLAMIAHPNVLVDLRQPVVHRGRSCHMLAHRLDDPAAFAAAITAVGGTND